MNSLIYPLTKSRDLSPQVPKNSENIPRKIEQWIVSDIWKLAFFLACVQPPLPTQAHQNGAVSPVFQTTHNPIRVL